MSQSRRESSNVPHSVITHYYVLVWFHDKPSLNLWMRGVIVLLISSNREKNRALYSTETRCFHLGMCFVLLSQCKATALACHSGSSRTLQLPEPLFQSNTNVPKHPCNKLTGLLLLQCIFQTDFVSESEHLAQNILWMSISLTLISAYSQIRDLLSTLTLKESAVQAYHSAVCNSRPYDNVLDTSQASQFSQVCTTELINNIAFLRRMTSDARQARSLQQSSKRNP